MMHGEVQASNEACYNPPMLSALRKALSNTRYDGVHALLFLAGACIGLWLLTLWSQYLPNATMPDILQNVLPWLTGNAQPEPSEHTLFTVGFFLIPLCSTLTWFLLRRFFLHKDADTAVRLAGTLAIFCAILWIVTVQSVGQVHVFDLSSSWYADNWKKLFPLTVSSSITMILVCVGLFSTWKPPTFTLPMPWLWEVITIGLFIAFLSYDPLSLLPWKPTDSSDDMWFIMPAWDILHGKQLLVTSESQYGFGIFYFLAAVFRVLGTSIQSLKLVEMITHATYYALAYILVRSICKTRRGAIIAFFFIIGGTIMRNELRFETYTEPSVTRLRNFWDIPVLLAFYTEYKTKNARWFLLSCILAAIAFLWNTDIGLSLTMITFVWACVLPLFQAHSIHRRMKEMATRIVICIGCIALAWALASFSLQIATGVWPDWSLNFFYTKLYLAGFGAMPMPIVGAYWAVLGIQMTAIITALAAWLLQRPLRNAPLLLTIGLYGFLTFNYYLNRSFIACLWAVSLPACLCGILLAQAYIERCKHEEHPTTLCSRIVRWPIMIIIGAFLGINLWIVGVGSWQMMTTRYPHIASAPVNQALIQNIQISAKAIDARVPVNEGAAVLSLREAIFLLEANRASAFHVPLLEMIFTADKLSAILTTFVQENHSYLFVEHDYTRCPKCDTVLSSLQPYYTLEKTEGLLDIYKRK